MRRVITGARWLGIIGLLICALPTAAQEGALPAVAQVEDAEPVAVRGPVDPAHLEAFFDGLMAAQLKDHHIAGATVAVVRDGAVLLAKGYGFADVENRRRVSPDTTLFRIGSISKTFVWTAIMQLVQQGRIDLDTDVNEYLTDLEVPATYDEPVRLRHLMTHTPGFEDQVIGLFARDETSLALLEVILQRELPDRVRPAGDVSSYSNHGTGIAALIVEEVSGLAWNDYVERHIIEPLGMIHTTFRQPFPAALDAVMSMGYSWNGTGFEEEDFEFVPLAPVGAAGATAADMARFMIAHLQLGVLDDVRILDESTALRMQGELFRHADRMHPMAHGFYEMGTNGERALGHGGDTLWFHSDMALLPAHGVGLFVSFNSAGGGGVTSDVYQAFMNEYFPVDDASELTAPADFAVRGQRFAGRYRTNRYSHSTLAKLTALGAAKVSVTEDGEALVTSATGATRWVEVAPLTFREEHGQRLIAFRQDDDGEITHLFLGWVPVVALERIGLTGNPMLHAVIAVSSLVLFMGAALLWPAAAALRRKHGYRLPPHRRMPLLTKSAGWLGSVLFLTFAAMLAMLTSDPIQIVFGAAPLLPVALTLPLLATPVVAAAIYLCAKSWRRRRGSFTARLAYTLLAIAFAATLWQLWYWNLLGYRY